LPVHYSRVIRSPSNQLGNFLVAASRYGLRWKQWLVDGSARPRCNSWLRKPNVEVYLMTQALCGEAREYSHLLCSSDDRKTARQ